VVDLEPKSGNLDDKFSLNRLGCGEFEPVLSLRLSRVNHACISNASHYYEEKTKTKVVFATKDIKGKFKIASILHLHNPLIYLSFFSEQVCDPSDFFPADDEITISYNGFLLVNTDMNEDLHSMKLMRKWNIICPKNCGCKDASLWRLDEKIKDLDGQKYL